jgi:hypothetical protein
LPGGFDGVLHDDFVEYGASGRRWDRAAILAVVRDAEAIPAASLSLEAFEATSLAEDVVLATYGLREHGPGRVSLRSSIWVRTAGLWRVRFHQGTRVLE